LGKLPTTLDAAFGTILKRIEGQEIGSATTGLRTLTWVYYSRRPLFMKELCEALLVEDDDSNPRDDVISPITTIDCCLSLVTLSGQTEEVCFIHPSVQRWLDDEPQHGKLLSECYLAKTCLTYLNFDVFNKTSLDNDDLNDDDPDHHNPDYHNSDHDSDSDDSYDSSSSSDSSFIIPCGNSDSDSDSDSDHRDSALLRHLNRYPFSGYASQFWHDHTRNVEENAKVQEIAFVFLQSHNKRNLMFRITKQRYRIDHRRPKVSVLHLLASCGLATLCGILLNVRGRYLA